MANLHQLEIVILLLVNQKRGFLSGV